MDLSVVVLQQVMRNLSNGESVESEDEKKLQIDAPEANDAVS